MEAGRGGGAAETAARRVRAAELYPRLRTHYDEPDLSVPFQPICGEFVQWVSRTADGGTLGMSTYRLHAAARRGGAGVSVPLRLIDAVEVRDLTHLVVYCKDGRTLKVRLCSGEACAEWSRRLGGALSCVGGLRATFAAAYAAWARELPPASAPRALLDPRHPHVNHNHSFKKEVQRLGFLTRGDWRVSTANSDYKLCASYPPLLIVPTCIGDEDLDSVARFRAMRRLPTVVWRHRGNGAVLARSSQPEVGWLGWRSSEDERLLAALVSACAPDQRHKTPPKLLVMDARSYTSAVTNRARGGGCECAQYYPHADIQFMNLPNIHHVRKSFHLLRQLAAEPPDTPNWHGALERSLWLQHVAGLGGAAALAARALLAGRPVLVHCSDGWDRTPQIVCATQLLLDPYYRTIEGFRVLVEREWLHFGHKFGERCGHSWGAEEPNERSPIFLQFLDLVHQMLLQFPCHFQFNEAYLIKLVTHAHSCLFGTFLCNSLRERIEARVYEDTAHVWKLLEGAAYRNHLYTPDQQQVLWLEYNVRSLAFWAGLYCGERSFDADEGDDLAQHNHVQNGGSVAGSAGGGGVTVVGMTKTRSCDNLAKESENKPAQRRCSDPTIPPDIINELARASTVSSGSSSAGDICTEPKQLHNLDNGLILGSTIDIEKPVGLDTTVVNNIIEHNLIDKTDTVDSNVNIDIDKEMSIENTINIGLEMGINITNNRVNGGGIENTGCDELSEDTQIEKQQEIVGVSEGPRENGDAPHSSLMTSNSSSLERELLAANNLQHENDERARTRHISIGWRSVSESSQQTDVTDSCVDIQPAELGRLDANDTSSDTDDEESEVGVLRRATGASQHTLCPNSPAARHTRTRRAQCSCSNTTHFVTGMYENSMGGGESLEAEACCCGPGRGARCVCGAGGEAGLPARDAIDGLAIHTTPVQATLHHIILNHKREVERLTERLRDLHRQLASTQSDAASNKTQSEGTSSCETEGEAEEGVEVGEEAVAAAAGVGAARRGVVWLPDSAAPRCQRCLNQFWLARRRHHCRRCGGVFCGSCARVRDSVRVCGACRR